MHFWSIVVCAGYKCIKHRQNGNYYRVILGMPVVLQQKKRCLVDDSLNSNGELQPLKRIKATVNAHHVAHPKPCAPMPSLEWVDNELVEEGDPHDDPVIAMPASSSAAGLTKVDSTKHFEWGDFSFTFIERIIAKGSRAGQRVTQWCCVCPYHHDDGDATGTKCRRTKKFEGSKQSQAVFTMLKQWAIAGRRSRNRAKRPQAHKDVKANALKKSPVEKLDEMREEGEQAEAWIIEGDSGDGASSSDDSTSMSSCSSTSSSSS